MNKMLLPYDIVGGSFWLISVAMIGATLFFFFERSKVSVRWHTPMTMIAVVCLMSSIHYFFVKNLWVVSGTAPTLLRYIDWFLTTPLLLVSFAFYTAYSNDKTDGLDAIPLTYIIVLNTLMLIAGFLGETKKIELYTGFFLGFAFFAPLMYFVYDKYVKDSPGDSNLIVYIIYYPKPISAQTG